MSAPDALAVHFPEDDPRIGIDDSGGRRDGRSAGNWQPEEGAWVSYYVTDERQIQIDHAALISFYVCLAHGADDDAITRYHQTGQWWEPRDDGKALAERVA